jgi:hypothetical protein
VYTVPSQKKRFTRVLQRHCPGLRTKPTTVDRDQILQASGQVPEAGMISGATSKRAKRMPFGRVQYPLKLRGTGQGYHTEHRTIIYETHTRMTAASRISRTTIRMAIHHPDFVSN